MRLLLDEIQLRIGSLSNLIQITINRTRYYFNSEINIFYINDKGEVDWLFFGNDIIKIVNDKYNAKVRNSDFSVAMKSVMENIK